MKLNKGCFLFFRHKVEYDIGFGYRCKRCGKTAKDCREGK